MKQDHFYVVEILQLPRHLEDECTGLCMEFGASGVSEDLSFKQPHLEYQAEIVPTDFLNLQVYFESPPPPELMSQLKKIGGEVKLQQKPNQDWLEEWKKGYEPFAFVDDIWIVPSWSAIPDGVTKCIRMEPGMAFGTGTHFTTQLAAKLLSRSSRLKNPNWSVVDVGTGTGLLAYLAEILGAKRVVANDIDPEALRVAGENLIQNNSTVVQVTDKAVNEISEKFDTVVANIVDGVLLQLKPHLENLVATKGELVLSGILKEREPNFIKAWLASGWKINERIQDDEWVAFNLQRQP